VRFKLDENLEGRLTSLLTDRGHEADSVVAEGLGGATDGRLFAKCTEDRRVLITLDLDFADPLRFPPAGGPGIMVLRPRRNTLAVISETLTAALPALERNRIEGALWIVEPDRIRVHRPWDDEDEA
jgi:predicted nuclease of predicted toxin-antitoxin system